MGRADLQNRAAVQALIWPHCLYQLPKSLWKWGSNPAGEKDQNVVNNYLQDYVNFFN